MNGPVQLPLDLPHRTASGRDDFLVTEANAAALAMIERWPDWPANVVALSGPAGCGKSHLAAVWREVSGAAVVAMDAVNTASVAGMMGAKALVVDDAPGEHLDERGLFHLINVIRERQGHLLLVCRQSPARWPVALADLKSRLKAVPVVAVEPPDDALLRALLVKLFADRQIEIDEAAISFMLRRMERTAAAAVQLVAQIDRRALAEKARISRSFIARVMREPDIDGGGDTLSGE